MNARLLWLLPLLLGFHLLAATYYVSTTGNDGADGSVATPWASPGFASRQLVPGDTLIILGGTYILSEYDADILIPPSGTPANWITIEGEPGNTPVLAGRDNLYSAVLLDGKHYLHFRNLEITHDETAMGGAIWFREGINMSGAPCSNLIFEDINIHHLDEFGIDAGDIENVQFLNCSVTYCGFGSLGGPEGVVGGWRNVTISGCDLSYSGHYYQGGDGSVRPYDRPDGFGIEASNGPILIEDTVFAHNYGDGLDSKAANTTIRRCMMANNSCDGLKLWGGGSRAENCLIYGRGDGNPTPTPWSAIVIGTTQANATFELVNLTVDDALGQNYIMHAQYDDNFPIQLTVQNCIFRGSGPNCPIWLRDTVAVTWLHNTFYFPQLTDFLEQGGQYWGPGNIASLGSENQAADPQFLSPAWGTAGNYHVAELSPVIDSGLAAGAPMDDLEGHPRDGQPDRGCYESVDCTASFLAQLLTSLAEGSWPLTHSVLDYVGWLNVCSN